MKAEIGQTDQNFRLGYIISSTIQRNYQILIFEVSHTFSNRFVKLLSHIVMVGDAGLEPATAPLSGVCSTV